MDMAALDLATLIPPGAFTGLLSAAAPAKNPLLDQPVDAADSLVVAQLAGFPRGEWQIDLPDGQFAPAPDVTSADPLISSPLP